MIAIAIAAAVAAAGFNLECSGTQWTGEEAKRLAPDKAKGTAFTDTYRINLTRSRWCFDKCETTHAIKAMTDTALILSADEQKEFMPMETSIVIDRETGFLMHRVSIGDYTYTRNGTCERQPLSGFPELKF